MTLPTKSVCAVVNRTLGGERREKREERVDESDEKVLGRPLGEGKDGRGEQGFLPSTGECLLLCSDPAGV